MNVNPWWIGCVSVKKKKSIKADFFLFSFFLFFLLQVNEIGGEIYSKEVYNFSASPLHTGSHFPRSILRFSYFASPLFANKLVKGTNFRRRLQLYTLIDNRLFMHKSTFDCTGHRHQTHAHIRRLFFAFLLYLLKLARMAFGKVAAAGGRTQPAIIYDILTERCSVYWKGRRNCERKRKREKRNGSNGCSTV